MCAPGDRRGSARGREVRYNFAKLTWYHGQTDRGGWVKERGQKGERKKQRGYTIIILIRED